MNKIFKLWRICIVLVLVLSACNLPFGAGKDNSLPDPASLPPMPPAVVETIPPAGSQVPLQASITFYFNQPMNRASVESALTLEPDYAGILSWLDDSIVLYTFSAPLPADSDVTFTLAAGALAKNGQALAASQNFSFMTADALRLVQSLPEDASRNVIATSSVVASFNQPVVPLGGESASLPAAFTLEPQATGKGEWLNTSTYIFYPQPALAGGISYTAHMNTSLVSTSGSKMSSGEDWSFVVAKPQLLRLEPYSEEPLSLDAEFILTFNQPMEPASVEAAFSLTGPDGRVNGSFTWDETNTILTFTPAALLKRNSDYTLVLGLQAQGRGGTPIENDSIYLMRTYPDLSVWATTPGEGGVLEEYRSPKIIFSAPLQEGDLSALITILPDVGLIEPYGDRTELFLWASFLPQTAYTVTISGDLEDAWGGRLGSDYTFHFTSAQADPRISFPWVGDDAFYVRSGRPEFYIQAVNVPYVDIELGSMPLDQFFYFNSTYDVEGRKTYEADDTTTWRQYIQGSANVNEPVLLQIPENGGALKTGVYSLEVTSPRVDYNPYPTFLVASGVNLTFKVGATEALVWAVDLRTDEPVAGGSVRLYTEDGTLVASGLTDVDGVWKGSIPEREQYDTYFAILGEPGEANFSLVGSDWDYEIAGWEYGLEQYIRGEYTDVYLYTDRPIYRPGQTVSFRALVRNAFDGQYTPAGLSNLDLQLSNDYGNSWDLTLPVSAFGTAHGEFTLPDEALPGLYTIQNSDLGLFFYFNVAEYRKPEINLVVDFDQDEIQNGASLQAEVNARYFFDAPSGSLPVDWVLYADESYFHLPDAHVGTFTDRWLNPDDSNWYDGFGKVVLSGKGVTGPDGRMTILLPAADLPDVKNLSILTLEVTAQDESGQPVSARTTAKMHPAEYYIGIRPDVWVGQAGTKIGFGIQSVDWNAEAQGPRPLHATFSAVTWVRDDFTNAYGDRSYTFTPVYELIGQSDFATGADGLARVEFTPQKAGTYLLDVSGGGAQSQAMIWVGGTSQAVWPNMPQNHVRLTADRDAYQVGQTAQVFIPNPIGGETLALVTMERGTVHSSQVLTLGPSGSVITIPLSATDAPNIYLSATLVGAGTFLQGYLNLAVEDPGRILTVELTSSPNRAGPGEPVKFDLRVTDQQGKPVQGEFSLAVVDLAALALADPNSMEIVEYYTDEDPLGMTTSISLASDPRRGVYLSGGIGGGGGGGDIAVVREDFPDTAYWNGAILTDADGRASVSMTLPDSLTTWNVDVRGVTVDTRVGQAQGEIITSKELLVRPVTPLFLVAGDHVEVGAVIHNNTGRRVTVKATLEAINFNLDRSPKQTQKVTILAGERALVTWWGTAQEAESAELTFSVQAGTLRDASKPANGALPILRYSSPETVTTAGILSSAGSRLEAVSLPRSFDPTSGGLAVELSPSLAAELLSGLNTLNDPPADASNEVLASYVLANVEVYRALRDAGLEDAALTIRAENQIVYVITRLENHQNYNDGGWAWYSWADYPWDYSQPESDPFLSAYILLGLLRARQAGFEVDDYAFERGREYLFNVLQAREGDEGELDRWAFYCYVLEETGGGDFEALTTLAANKEFLLPWAQAFLALAYDHAYPGSSLSDELLTSLEGTAIRSASGAYWESGINTWRQPSSTLVTTAITAYALAERDPASPLLADAIRYLSMNRGVLSLWGSSYETTWIILALNAYMIGTGGYAADYSFNASLNNVPIAEGQASGPNSLMPVLTSVPITSLLPDHPNALVVTRGEGTGSLYYRAHLQVYQPVENVQALNRGIGIERTYSVEDCESDCQPIHRIQLVEGERLRVSLTLTLPHDAYYLMVQDAIPAGAEILNTALKTSEQGEGTGIEVQEVIDPENPYSYGWGWWYFSSARIFDDHVTWSADFLPAGKYVLTYTLIPMRAGEFRVLPAQTWLNFFPEVQGRSAGEIFTITR